MRHDRNYRRVLRSHEDYLARYKFFATLGIVAYLVKFVYDRKKGQSEENRLSSKLQNFKNKENEIENEDIIKYHEKWYYTLLDKRLWFFVRDLLNLSKIHFPKDMISDENSKNNDLGKKN